MNSLRHPIVVLWLVLLAIAAALILRTPVGTDMSAFLPRTPDATERLLVDQLKNGVVSSVLLVAIDADRFPAGLAKSFAGRLRQMPALVDVADGEADDLEADARFVWAHRYLLSPGVTAERFSATGLRTALERDLRLLGTETGAALERTLPADPTGEAAALAGLFTSGAAPNTRDGVWASPDGKRALMILRTRAEGFDIDAQQGILQDITTAFDAAKREMAGAASAQLTVSGPAVFAVRTRALIERDATRLSVIATLLVALLLYSAYRSVRLLAAGLLPVATGAAAGIAAVGLAFGSIHGITLGFGVTLIGEAVDYPVYLLSGTLPGATLSDTLRRIWPTLRLGVATSVAGFGAMLFSGFTGFAQLGLFTIAGLLAAAATTRWILPILLPAALTVRPPTAPLLVIGFVRRHAGPVRAVAVLLVLPSIMGLGLRGGGIWASDIDSLSPLLPQDQTIDRTLRTDLGAPDVRFLVAVDAPTEQAALEQSEAAGNMLTASIRDGTISGFDTPAIFLPSDRTQRARQAALPDAPVLAASLDEALAGLPFHQNVFAPFSADVAAARLAPTLTREALAGTKLGLRVDALLVPRPTGWTAVMPLAGVANPALIRERIAAAGLMGVVFLDLKQASATLLNSYLNQCLILAGVGSAAIAALLAVSLRSWRRVARVLLPLLVSVALTAAVLSLGGRSLTIFNLFGLLLVVAIGSNYSLFFERMGVAGCDDRTVAATSLANCCTVIGFGLLALSNVPVLHGIGTTVAIGTILSLVLAASLTRPATVR